MDKSIKKLLNFTERIYIDETTIFNIFKQNQEGGMGSISFGILEFDDVNYVNCWAMKNVKLDDINEENIEKFENEAKLWIQLKHPNIVRAFYYKIINEIPRIFMEPVISEDNKNTLKDYLNDNLSVKTILDWSIQFCYGMIYANDNGIAVHRDIKPENILIKDKILKISDFGISSSKSIKYENKILPGTLEYKAPETFQGIADVRSDIYSWGMVMYNMIKNNLFIYDYVFPENINFKYSVENYLILHEKGYIFGFQSPMKHIIFKCLEKNPNERYNNFSELLKDLKLLFVDLFNEKELYTPIIKELDEADLTSLLFSYCELNENENIQDYIQQTTNKNMYSVLGTIYQINGDEKKSIEYFNKAIDEFPNEFGIRYDYATALSKMNKYDESEKQFKVAINLNPNDKSCHVNYGILLMNIGRYDSAVHEFKKVIKVYSSFFKAKLNLMFCYIKMNKFDKSDVIYNEIKDNNEFTKEIEISRAIYTMYQDYHKAKNLFEKLKIKYPNDWRVLSEISHFYYINNKYLEAEKYYSEFLDICPDVKKTIPYKAQTLRELSEISLKNDNLDEALSYIDESLIYDDCLNSRINKILILKELSKNDVNYDSELKEYLRSFNEDFPNFIIEAKEKCLTFIKEDIEEFYKTINIILIFEPDFDYKNYYQI